MTTLKARNAPDTRVSADAKRLHDATDELNTTIQEFEQTLQSLGFGVAASVKFDEQAEVDENGTVLCHFVSYLAFAKIGNSFRLFIEAGLDVDEELSHTELLSSARETRLKAVAAFPSLHRELKKQLESEISRVAEATAAVKDLISQIRTEKQTEQS